MNIYSWDFSIVFLVMLISILGIFVATNQIAKNRQGHLALVAAATALSASALYAILFFTVFSRTPSGAHIFIVSLDTSSNELIREMVMNGFLYFPFGLFLPYVLDSVFSSIKTRLATSRHYPANTPILVTIAISFLLSLPIESWQYYAGTGIAQLTDVV